MKKPLKKVLSPVNQVKGQEILYRKQLNRLARGMQKAVRNQLLAYMEEHEGEYVYDGLAADLDVIFRRLNAQFNGTMTMGFAKVTSEDMVRRLEKSNKKRFDDNFMRATGIDLGSIMAVEGLSDFLDISIQQNVLLIKSLPEEYFKQIEIIVNKGFTSGARYSTISKEISSLHGSANSKLMNRIKTIARDQISTINSQMTMKRSLSLGITKGIYRTSKDERVRKCHKELDGVEFVLTKGAWSKTCKKFIQPGITDINCRCSYSPVIDLDDIAPTSKVPAVDPAVEAGKEAEKERLKVEKTLRSQLKKEEAARKKAEEEMKRLLAEVEKAKPEPEKDLKEFKNLVGSSPEDIKKAIIEQGGDLPSSIRDYLFGPEVNMRLRIGGELDDRIKEQMEGLDEALNIKQIKEPIQLHRGLMFKSSDQVKEFLEKAKPGTIQSDKGFVSTTTGEIQEYFKRDEPIHLIILADENTKGVYLPHYENLKGKSTTVESEKEFLLPRDTKMQVVGPHKIIDGVPTVYMKVINE